METTRLIEKYLDGTLSIEERNAIEEKAISNEEFRRLIVLHKEVNDSIRDNDFFILHDLIARIGRVYHPPEISVGQVQERKMRRIPFRMMARIAAMLVLLTAAGYILRYSVFSHSSADRLYQKYYAVYDLDVISRSAPTRRAPLDEAMLSYDQGKYQDALAKLNVILLENQNNYMALFFKGLTLMETGDPMNAIRSFREIPVKWHSPFTEHRDWYLALALLKTNKTGESAQIFQQIASGGGYYAHQAEQILKRFSD